MKAKHKPPPTGVNDIKLSRLDDARLKEMKEALYELFSSASMCLTYENERQRTGPLVDATMAYATICDVEQKRAELRAKQSAPTKKR